LTNKSGGNISGLAVDSLTDLLVGQCSDLEALLKLARRETLISESNDFNQLLTVVEERASLGDRLETYQRQIAELRTTLGHAADPMLEGPVAKQTIRLALEIEAQDSRTIAWLNTARTNTTVAMTRLDQGRRNFLAYLREAQTSGLNCDRRG
jgi:hypothetical protein